MICMIFAVVVWSLYNVMLAALKKKKQREIVNISIYSIITLLLRAEFVNVKGV